MATEGNQYIAQRKIVSTGELLKCQNTTGGDCKSCNNFTTSNLNVYSNASDGKDNVFFHSQTPYYKDDGGPNQTQPDGIGDNYYDPLARNRPGYQNVKQITEPACKVPKDVLQELRCYCDYAAMAELSNPANISNRRELWDMLAGGREASEGKLKDGLEKVQAYLNSVVGDADENKAKEAKLQIMGLLCRMANTTNPRDTFDKSAIPLVTTIRLTGWVSGNTISLVANLIFFILNVLFFSSFINTLGGYNDKNEQMISYAFKITYQIFLFGLSAIILTIVLGGAISRSSFSVTGNYLLILMTYSSVFAVVIVLFLLLYAGIKLSTMSKTTAGSGATTQIIATFVIIGLVALITFIYLVSAGKIPSMKIMVMVSLFGFFVISMLYYKGKTDKSVNTSVGIDRQVGLIAYSILILETIFGLFFPYLYFMFILVLRLITGMLLKTTFWTLLPFYVISFMMKIITGKETKIETIVGVTDFNMFQNNFLSKTGDGSGISTIGQVAVISLIVLVFTLLLSMGI